MTDASQGPVWAVVSYRAGENSQILGLLNRIGLSFEIKRLEYNGRAGPLGLGRRIDPSGSNAAQVFKPPWPALIVSAGVKNEPICRWVKAQSGGRTRLVFLGRTWAARQHFDLVITTPQYRLPDEPNVIHNLMTQHGITAERLADAAQQWRAKLSGLRRPLIGVLVGGDSGPYVFGVRAAARLARALNRLVVSIDGSILVTTSSRTRDTAVDELERLLGNDANVYRWRPDDPGNPYFGLLAHADRLVQLKVIDGISHETVRQELKKNDVSLA